MKQRFTRTVTIAILGLVAATARPAGAYQTLVSPPAQATAFGNFMDCTVVNVGTAPVVVRLATKDYAGTVLDQGPDESLASGEGTTRSGTPNGLDSYCEFTVVQGNKKSLRANAVYSAGLTFLMVLPAR